jgi:cytochrome c2
MDSPGLNALRRQVGLRPTIPKGFLATTWSEETFAKYIREPMHEMPGTRMAFVGIKNDKDIADLWAYLEQFGADGAKK